jgi:hypothetical protein
MYLDSRADRIAIRFRTDQLQAEGPVSVIQIVAIQIRRTRIRRDQDIQIAIVIEVPVSGAASHLRIRESAANCVRDVGESSACRLQEQLRLLREFGGPDVPDRVVDMSVGHE